MTIASGRSRARLDPDAMLVFGAVARAGGVRGAAALLGTPRSTVSRKLAALEREIGALLVVRTARRFALTELGVAFAGECDALERVLGAAEDLVRRGLSEPSGTLRVAVAPVLGEEILPQIVAELAERHPRLSIDARLAADHVDLRRGAFDVALRAAVLEDATDLFAVRLGASVTGCYASPVYVERHGAPTAPADLQEHACILVSSSPRVTWKFAAGARATPIDVTGRIRVDSFRVARDLAARGAGVVRLAEVFAEPFVTSGDLVPLLTRWWPSVPIHAVHAGPNPPVPAVRAFIEAARAAVGRVLPKQPSPARRTRWRSA